MITKKLSELGRLSRDEKIVAAVFISTAAWITRGLLWKRNRDRTRNKTKERWKWRISQ
jgi:hypothetical protein